MSHPMVMFAVMQTREQDLQRELRRHRHQPPPPVRRWRIRRRFMPALARRRQPTMPALPGPTAS